MLVMCMLRRSRFLSLDLSTGRELGDNPADRVWLLAPEALRAGGWGCKYREVTGLTERSGGRRGQTFVHKIST